MVPRVLPEPPNNRNQINPTLKPQEETTHKEVTDVGGIPETVIQRRSLVSDLIEDARHLGIQRTLKEMNHRDQITGVMTHITRKTDHNTTKDLGTM